MKLKTLKDIRKSWDKTPFLSDGGNCFREGMLIGMAMDRINSCENSEDFSTHNRCGFYYDKEKKEPKFRPVFCEVCLATMEIFNIEVEDLK